MMFNTMENGSKFIELRSDRKDNDGKLNCIPKVIPLKDEKPIIKTKIEKEKENPLSKQMTEKIITENKVLNEANKNLKDIPQNPIINIDEIEEKARKFEHQPKMSLQNQKQKDFEKYKIYRYLNSSQRSSKTFTESSICGSENFEKEERKPLSMVELMKLYRQRKEREFRKVVNSPFTAYKLQHKLKCYELKKRKENPDNVELVPIEGQPKPFDRVYPSNKDIYRRVKRMKSEKDKIRNIYGKTQSNFDQIKRAN